MTYLREHLARGTVHLRPAVAAPDAGGAAAVPEENPATMTDKAFALMLLGTVTLILSGLGLIVLFSKSL